MTYKIFHYVSYLVKHVSYNFIYYITKLHLIRSLQRKGLSTLRDTIEPILGKQSSLELKNVEGGKDQLTKSLMDEQKEIDAETKAKYYKIILYLISINYIII